MNIEQNIQELNKEIEKLKIENQINHDITVLAATKYVGIEEIDCLVKNGIHHIGENKVQDFIKKYDLIQSEAITWHFIGSLQTNKVKQMINKIDYLHSLDRINLAKEINKHANKVISCFIEVNCSGEENKHGVDPKEVTSFIQGLKDYEKIKIVGLMTMAEHTDNVDVIRQTFRQLRELRDEVIKLQLPFAPCTELSMGMSQDFHYAILEGATWIRIGSRLFR